MELNILICGIGGQGVIFLGKIIRRLFFDKFPNATVIGTESRGVSQREGSVISTIRISIPNKPNATGKLLGPEISPHEADVIIALEPIEFLRNLSYVNERTLLIVNSTMIKPKNILIKQLSGLNAKSIGDKKDKEKNISKNSDLDLNPKKFRDRIIGLLDLLNFDGILDEFCFTKESRFRFHKEFFATMAENGQAKEEIRIKKQTIKNIDSNLRYCDFSSIILDIYDSTAELNMLMFGFLTTFLSNIFSYKEIRTWLENYLTSTEHTDKSIKRNLEVFYTGIIHSFISC